MVAEMRRENIHLAVEFCIKAKKKNQLYLLMSFSTVVFNSMSLQTRLHCHVVNFEFAGWQ